MLPVQQLVDADAMTEAFCWLMEHGRYIRSRLEDVMPAYIRSAEGIREKVEAVIGS